jgi:hypothetical protein
MGAHWLQADLSYPSKRIPLPWAAAILLVLVLPLGFYLGKWNLPLWVCFIVWAEYFALGAKLETWKIMIPSLAFGGLVAALWCSSAVGMSKLLVPEFGSVHGQYAAYALTNLVWVPVIVYGLQWTPAFTAGSLAVFNGFTLQLAVYFTGTAPPIGPMENAYFVVWWSFLWAVLNAFLGWGFGWFNVFLTFPHKPEDV